MHPNPVPTLGMVAFVERQRAKGAPFYAIVRERFAEIESRIARGETLDRICDDLGIRRTHIATVNRNDAELHARFLAAMETSKSIRAQRRADNCRANRLAAAKVQREFADHHINAVFAKIGAGMSIAAACRSVPGGLGPRQVEAAIQRDPALRARFRAESKHLQSQIPLVDETFKGIFSSVADGKSITTALAEHSIEYGRFHWRVARDPLLKLKLGVAKATNQDLRRRKSNLCATQSLIPAEVRHRDDRLAAEIWRRIRAVVPRHDQHDDVVSEMVLAVLSGEMGLDDITPTAARRYSDDFTLRFASLDKPRFDDSKSTLLDSLSNPW